jgi:hypothetical protein
VGEVLGFRVFTSVHIFCPFQLRNKGFVEGKRAEILWNCWLFVNKSGGANKTLLENYVFSILLADFCRDNFCEGT